MTHHSAGTPAGASGEPRPRHALPEPLDGDAGTPGADGDARPPRPQMERTPAPASPALVRPGLVDLALGLYYGGLGAGAVGVVSALLWRAGARENLLAMMAESAVEEARKQQVADLVLYGTIGVIVLLLFVQLALVARLAAGRAGARPGLVLVVAAQALLYFFASGIVRDTGWEGLVVQIGLGLHAAAGVLAAVLSWLPPVGRWLGRRSAARRQQ